MKAPTVVARCVAGSFGVAFMTRLRGADNSAAHRTLRWHPDRPSWRDGFAADLRTPVLQEER